MQDYDYLVFIGRFQPFHKGHQRVVDHALSKSKKLIILLGSANVARNARNPWTYEERYEMIRRLYPIEVQESRIILAPQNDQTYNDAAWVEQAQVAVKTIVNSIPGNKPGVTLHGYNDLKIGLIGCNKDASSYYLKLFPTWDSLGVPYLDPIDSTDIRNLYFNNGLVDCRHLPLSISKELESFKHTTPYKNLREEILFIEGYKEQWSNSPYPPTFVTVDAVVIQSGHVLVVRRGAQPGKGQFALPGGFINVDEKIEDAVFRELDEETGIKVPEAVLRGSVVAKEVFDDPNRSTRGRTITHASLIKLKDDIKLPKVKGGDDAVSAQWLPLADIKEMSREFYEDHWFIIQNMIGLL